MTKKELALETVARLKNNILMQDVRLSMRMHGSF